MPLFPATSCIRNRTRFWVSESWLKGTPDLLIVWLLVVPSLPVHVAVVYVYHELPPLVEYWHSAVLTSSPDVTSCTRMLTLGVFVSVTSSPAEAALTVT